MNAVSRPEPEPEPEYGREARIARHIRYCRELAAMSALLAEVAAERALSKSSGPNAAKWAAANTPDYSTMFINLTNEMCRAMHLQADLAAGLVDTMRPSPAGKRPRPDLRRNLLREAFNLLTEGTPCRTRLLRDLRTRIDQDLAADPDCAIDITIILRSIVQDFGIVVEYGQFPDAVLEVLTGRIVDEPFPGFERWDPVAWFIANDLPPAPLAQD